MKIAVITGGGSGLGSVYLAAIRKRYPELDEYWIIDIQKDKLEEIAKADSKIVPVVMNLADGDSFRICKNSWRRRTPISASSSTTPVSRLSLPLKMLRKSSWSIRSRSTRKL